MEEGKTKWNKPRDERRRNVLINKIQYFSRSSFLTIHFSLSSLTKSSEAGLVGTRLLISQRPPFYRELFTIFGFHFRGEGKAATEISFFF